MSKIKNIVKSEIFVIIQRNIEVMGITYVIQYVIYYQILSIIFLKELIKLNVNMDTIIKNVKLVELIVNVATAFLNTQTLKII